MLISIKNKLGLNIEACRSGGAARARSSANWQDKGRSARRNRTLRKLIWKKDSNAPLHHRFSHYCDHRRISRVCGNCRPGRTDRKGSLCPLFDTVHCLVLYGPPTPRLGAYSRALPRSVWWQNLLCETSVSFVCGAGLGRIRPAWKCRSHRLRSPSFFRYSDGFGHR